LKVQVLLKVIVPRRHRLVSVADVPGSWASVVRNQRIDLRKNLGVYSAIKEVPTDHIGLSVDFEWLCRKFLVHAIEHPACDLESSSLC
jgi:hypothetical protein